MRYNAARALPEQALALAMETLQSLLSLKRVQRVLDLGAGTGRFSKVLQQTIGCPVSAVDPSEAMLAQGKNRQDDKHIEWRPGSAEHIPLRARSVDLVWMCQAFPHLDDPALISIPDGAFTAGLQRLTQWAAEKPAGQAVYEPVDLFVFQVNP